jgi:hypothetical protein
MTDAAVANQARASCLSRLGRLVLAVVVALPLGAQAAAPSAAVAKAEQQVAAIDARSKERAPLRERPLDGFASEGARVVAWGAPGAIEKISVEGLGERGRVLLDFYLQRGQLVAARSRRLDYGAHIMELPKDKPTPMTVVEDEWLEFAGDRVLRRRELDRELPAGDASARQRASELRASARAFRRLVDAPEPPPAQRGSCAWSCALEQRGECMRYRCR